jgi:hypothetical protein
MNGLMLFAVLETKWPPFLIVYWSLREKTS